MLQKGFACFFVFCSLLVVVFGSGTLTLKTTSPVALDTPIWFTAEYFPYKGDNLKFRFEDSLGNSQTIRVKGPSAEWMVLYDSLSYWTYTGEQEITCTVSRERWGFPEVEATSTVNFVLTDSITARTVISQPNVTAINVGKITTLNETNITTIIHDPKGWIRDHTIEAHFFFHINNQNHSEFSQKAGPCSSPSVIVNITHPGSYIIEGTTVLAVSRDPVTTPAPTTTTTTTPTTTTSTSTTEVPSNQTTTTAAPTTTTTTAPTTTTTKQPPKIPTFFCSGQNYSKVQGIEQNHVNTKYIFAYTSVTAGEPIGHYDITGNTWLKHGEMLLLNATCTGTGPFSFCYNITQDFDNGTDMNVPDLSSDSSVPSSSLMRPVCLNAQTNRDCRFHIKRYLRWPGMYTLTLQIENDYSSIVESVALNIYEDGKNVQLSYIVIPIIFGLLAIIFVLIGVSIYVRNQRRYEVEVADFDFESSDGREYKSFKQVLKEAFYASFTTHEPPHNRFSNVEHPNILEGYD